jgi:uncharacterized protein (TIGR02284 family)
MSSSTDDLRDLLSALRDGVMFYAEAGERAEHAAHRELFAQMATDKREAARTVEKLLGPIERPADGTWSAKIKEGYTRIRALLSADKDVVFINELEAAEDRVVEHFRRCLCTAVEPNTHRVLERIYPAALAAHQRMREMKHAAVEN